MADGTQIIEVEELWKLVSKTAHLQFSVAVLSWLVSQLNCRATGRLEGLEFSVIRVQYVSRYPSIGVKYLDGDDDDKEADVLDTISNILKTTTLQNFVDYLCTRESWSDVAKDIIDE